MTFIKGRQKCKMITNLKIHIFKAWIYILEIEMRVKQCTISQVIKCQVPLFPTQTDCVYLTKSPQKAVMENVQCRHLPLVGVSKRDKKQRSANHVICGCSALENTMQQNSYSRFPRQLITLSIMWSLYQSNVNWSLRKYKWALIEGERASDIFASNAVCSTSALERIRGSQVN